MTGRIDGRNRRQTRTTTLADWKKTHKGLEVGQTLSQPTGDPKLRNKTTAPISFTQPQTQQVTALTVVPKQELPTMAELLKKQYGTNNIGLEFNNVANPNVFGGTAASTSTITNPARLLGYPPSRTINAFEINGKYFLLENGKTIGCFDKADWTKQLRQLKTEGAKIVLGEPTVPATVAPATTTTSAPKNVLALDAPKTATVAPATAEAPKAAPKPTAIWAYPEDAPATPETPQTEAPKASATPEAPQAEKPIKPKKAGKGLGKFFKGKKGKVALVAGLALAGLALLKACSDDKKPEAPAENPEPVKPTPTPAAPVENPEQGENPTPAAPVENPEQGENPTPAVPVENPEEGTTPAPVQPEQPAQPVASENIIQNGDSLEDVANRYGVTVEQLKELNADKIKHFKTADGKVIDGFIVGEDIKLPDGTAKVEDLKTKDETVADYEEYLVKNFDQIPQSMWNQVCTPEFRRRHKLGEYKEAA